MKKTIAKVAFLVLIFIGGIFFIFNLIHSHELTHKNIFEDYQINSTIEIDYFNVQGTTTPEKNCPSNECRLAHENSDSFFYPFSVFCMYAFAFFFLYFMFKFLFFEDEEEERWS